MCEKVGPCLEILEDKPHGLIVTKGSQLHEAQEVLKETIENDVKPTVEQLHEEQWEWLQRNDYEQVLDVDIRRQWHQQLEEKHMVELQNELADKELEIKNSYKRIQDGQKNAEFYRKETMKLDKDINLLNADLQNLRVLEEVSESVRECKCKRKR